MFDSFLTPVLIVGMICAGIYGLFELFVRKKERLALIEKLGEGSLQWNSKLRLPNYSGVKFSFSALKVGALLAGAGLGLLVGFFINWAFYPSYLTGNWERSWTLREVFAIVYGASMFLFGGLGLLLAFLIEIKYVKNREEQDEKPRSGEA